jgi:dihydroflavonol-4-reductase
MWDLAVAHRLALETPDAVGNRYICAGEHVWMAEIGRQLAEEFGPRGFRVPTRVIPDVVVRAIALFDKGIRLTLPMLGRRELLSSEKARRELGWSMRLDRETVLDTAESLIQYDIVRAARGGSASRRLAAANPVGA